MICTATVCVCGHGLLANEAPSHTTSFFFFSAQMQRIVLAKGEYGDYLFRLTSMYVVLLQRLCFG